MTTHRNEHTGSAPLDRIQANVRTLIERLKLVPFLFGGRLVSVTFAAATRKEVRHDLGTPAACIVVRLNYDSAQNGPRFAEHATRAADERTHLALVADAACTVDLWFYARASKALITASGQSA